MNLDEDLRAQLRTLVDAEEAEELTPAMRVRIIADATRRVDARRSKRVLLASSFGAAALTALTLAMLVREQAPRPTRSAKNVEIAAPTNGTDAADSPPRCRGPEVEPSFDAEHVIDVERARVVHSEGAKVTLVRFDDCATELSLGEGAIFVFARDLAGGALRIRAGQHEVEVHGTVFSVEGNADELTVRVDEGLVSWRRGELERQFVSAGNVLEVDDAGARMRSLRRSERAQLRKALGLSEKAPSQGVQRGAPPGADAGSTSAPLPTQKIWHQGGLQTFEPPPPELPALIPDDGQPLKKPTLIPASRHSAPALR